MDFQHDQSEVELYRQLRRRALEAAGSRDLWPWELGERLGMSESSVRDLLNGEAPISAWLLGKLAGALGCDLAWLLTGESRSVSGPTLAGTASALFLDGQLHGIAENELAADQLATRLREASPGRPIGIEIRRVPVFLQATVG